jgi:hypothetical protein
MTTFPGSPKLLNGGIVADPFCDSAGAADHFAAIQSRIAEPHNPGAERERGGERSEALRQMDRKYNGVFNLSIGSRTISAIKQFGFGQLLIHSR